MLLLLFGLLALRPQVVLSAFFKLGLSQVKQCDRFTVNFEGELNKTSPPSSLTFLPFDSVPISIPVPPNALSYAALDINFIPLKENTSFIVSLDNAEGEGLSLASDVIWVSSSQNTSCLPSPLINPTPPSPYAIVGSVRQCENFTVQYNTTNPPSVRMFFLDGFSFALTMTSKSNGTATYTMPAGFGQQILLLFDDGNRLGPTSELLKVDGDSSSSRECLNFTGQDQQEQSNANSSPKVSKGVVIGLCIGGGIVFLVALAMAMFVLRERKRRRRLVATSSVDNPPSQQSQGRDTVEKPRTSLPLPPLPTSTAITYPEGYGKSLPSPPLPTLALTTYPEGYVKDPPYVSEKYSPTISDYPRTSISWEMVDAETQPEHRNSQSTRLSIMDIEKMLDIAAERNSLLPTTAGSTPPVQYQYSRPEDPSLTLSDQRYRSQPDVPENPSSYSESSLNAEMQKFGGDAGSVQFFENPEAASGLQSSISSFEARISDGSISPRFIIHRSQNAYLPPSPRSSAYPSGVLDDKSEVVNSVPFPVTGGTSRESNSGL